MTVTVLWPPGTLTGRAPLTGLGLRATGASVTDTWVVMGLNTPAGFWVTMVLVTELWTRLWGRGWAFWASKQQSLLVFVMMTCRSRF